MPTAALGQFLGDKNADKRKAGMANTMVGNPAIEETMIGQVASGLFDPKAFASREADKEVRADALREGIKRLGGIIESLADTDFTGGDAPIVTTTFTGPNHQEYANRLKATLDPLWRTKAKAENNRIRATIGLRAIEAIKGLSNELGETTADPAYDEFRKTYAKEIATQAAEVAGLHPTMMQEKMDRYAAFLTADGNGREANPALMRMIAEHVADIDLSGGTGGKDKAEDSFEWVADNLSMVKLAPLDMIPEQHRALAAKAKEDIVKQADLKTMDLDPKTIRKEFTDLKNKYASITQTRIEQLQSEQLRGETKREVTVKLQEFAEEVSPGVFRLNFEKVEKKAVSDMIDSYGARVARMLGLPDIAPDAVRIDDAKSSLEKKLEARRAERAGTTGDSAQ